MKNKKLIIIGSTTIVVLGIVIMAFKKRQEKIQSDISNDQELQDLITKIDNAPK